MDERKRVAYKKIDGEIKYRIFNDIIQVDIDSILWQIGKSENLGYEPADGVSFQAFKDRGEKISPSVFRVRIGTKVYTFKTEIKRIEIEDRQKMSFDTVQVNRWSDEAFISLF